ncbi:hypothetical protein LOY42_13785 [Pseudomonas sp. B21-023]|uniref:hypothetical protein n=1 Tax=unclassified Pseudomonas TaxID=196821 RepID=UPI0015542D34|nr:MULTISPECIES: hypothetical protein [unclassified Pseudomonas]NQD77564.1 hypothetical protein [Pseudomonas sp. CM27]UVM14377.1 hypothetical protein LOY42_13785 [Pseudomonas sp. B21-023]
MITLTQIKLHDAGIPHGMSALNEKAVKQPFYACRLQVDASDSLYIFNAFLVITKKRSTARTDLTQLRAFRGFLSIEMAMNDDDARYIVRPIAEALFSSVDEASKATDQIIDSPIARCKQEYLALSPSKRKVEEYQSVFECQDHGIGICVDFGRLRALLGEADLTYFSQLLARHLKTTSHVYAQGFGNSICGIMQGLVYENPGKPLPELRLDKQSTNTFIKHVEYQAIDQVMKAGYTLVQAFENREVIRDLISKFFISNVFLSASK